jgi:RNA polymerase sigma factor (sigma-70 family)
MFPTNSKDLALIESMVRKAARRLKKYPILSNETEDDLFQDLYEALLRAWPNYDPEKGPIHAFIWWILKRKSQNILRKYCCQKRPISFLKVSLEDDLIEDENAFTQMEKVLMTVDLQRKLRRLPEAIRTPLEQLKEKNPSYLSKEMNISRNKFNKVINQSRSVFSEFSPDFLFQNPGRCVCQYL